MQQHHYLHLQGLRPGIGVPRSFETGMKPVYFLEGLGLTAACRIPTGFALTPIRDSLQVFRTFCKSCRCAPVRKTTGSPVRKPRKPMIDDFLHVDRSMSDG